MNIKEFLKTCPICKKNCLGSDNHSYLKSISYNRYFAYNLTENIKFSINEQFNSFEIYELIINVNHLNENVLYREDFDNLESSSVDELIIYSNKILKNIIFI